MNQTHPNIKTIPINSPMPREIKISKIGWNICITTDTSPTGFNALAMATKIPNNKTAIESSIATTLNKVSVKCPLA